MTNLFVARPSLVLHRPWDMYMCVGEIRASGRGSLFAGVPAMGVSLGVPCCASRTKMRRRECSE